MKKAKQDLTQGDIKSQFIKLSIPVALGMLALMLFGIIDSYFIAMLGTEPLSAMGLSFPLIVILIGIFLGLGNGVFAFVSPAFGKKSYKEAIKYCSQGTFLGCIIISILLVITFLAQPIIYEIMKIPNDIKKYVYDYMNIWFIAGFFTGIHIIWEKVLHGVGDTKSPAIALIVSAMTNLILDPLLIFGIWIFPELGVKGASLATLIGNFFGFLIIFRKVFKLKLLAFSKLAFQGTLIAWKKIINISLPSIYYPTLITFTVLMLNYMVIPYGNEVIAGVGVALRFERLAAVTFIAITVAAMAIIGQNFGVMNRDRILKTITYATNFYIFSFAIAFILYLVFGKAIVKLFSQEKEVMNSAYYFLIITSVSLIGQGLMHLGHSAFNTFKKVNHSYIIVTIQSTFIIASSYLGMFLFGFIGILLGFSFGKLISGSVQLIYLRKLIKNLIPED